MYKNFLSLKIKTGSYLEKQKKEKKNDYNNNCFFYNCDNQSVLNIYCSFNIHNN